MGISRRTDCVRLPGGGEVPVFAAIPAKGSGPGMLLFQEIFGLNEHIQHRAERLAGLGYVTLAPDLYWRLGPDTAIDEAGDGALEKAFRLRTPAPSGRRAASWNARYATPARAASAAPSAAGTAPRSR